MLVSHDQRFIYTKTVKTAGSSVESYFERYCMGESEREFNDARKEYISESGIIGVRTNSPLELQASTYWNHMPAITIKALLGDAAWNDYFKFCVVRNPFDQLVSAYNYFHARKITGLGGFYRSSRERLRSGSFRDASLKEKFSNWLRTAPLPLDRNKYMIDGEYCMDFVIQYESLNDGMKQVCNELNIGFTSTRLKHLKKQERKRSIKEYYSDDSIKLVEDTHAYELQKFGYSTPWHHT